MEYNGRIIKVLPLRTGTSSKGVWMSLQFIFEFFENDDQRWSDKVQIETMDRAVIGQIASYVVRDSEHKGVMENGSLKLRGNINCRCGFSHSVQEYTDKAGNQGFFNKSRLYKFELTPVTGTAAAYNATPGSAPYPAIEAAGTAAGNYHNMPSQQPSQQEQDNFDDLPF